MIPWRFNPVICREELLSSFLLRTASMHGALPHPFYAFHLSGQSIWTRDIDRAPPEVLLNDIALASDQSFEVISEMTFRRLAEVFNQPTGVLPWLMPVGVWHRKRRNYGLRFCPYCLEEPRPYFRKIWRLAFVVNCPSHLVELLDACAFCGAPVIPHRCLGLQVENCHNCGKRLSLSKSFSSNPECRQVVRSLMSAYQGSQVTLGTKMIPPADWLRGCRQLLSLVIHRFLKTASLQEGRKKGRRIFETMEASLRIQALDVLKKGLSDWPQSFLDLCELGGITQKSFSRMENRPPWLDQQIELLRPGNSRSRMIQIPPLGLKNIQRSSEQRHRKRAEAILGHLKQDEQVKSFSPEEDNSIDH